MASTGGYGFTSTSEACGCLPVDKRVAGLGVVELAEGDGFAGGGRPAFLGMLAHQLEDSGDAAGLAVGVFKRDAVAGLPASMRAIDILPPCAV